MTSSPSNEGKRGTRCGYLILFILVFLHVPLHAQSAFEPCVRLYENRDFASALSCVNSGFDSIGLLTRKDSLKAFELGAILCYILDKYDSANIYFDRVLFLDPKEGLDPLNVPPEIIAMFETRKAAFLEKFPQFRDTIPVLKKSILKFMPYGAGHIKEKKYKRGIFYAAVSVLALGANISSYYMRKSMENPDHTYNNVKRAEMLYNTQVISFYGVFLGTGLVSFLDALFTN